jgi:putative membrane protein
LIRWLFNAIALWIAALVVDGVELSGSPWQILLVALLFGLVNALIKPLFQFFTAPLIVVTLGIFTLLINAFLLWLTSLLTNTLSVDSFWAALFGALIISVVSWVFSLLLGD